ncbi:MAG: hypothetical protein KTR17_06450, partial [Cellvibrionaceae bacterium]|nr:hypothetical protein [Cellvibrionaceae bacterium]
MRELIVIVRAQLGFYRRHPLVSAVFLLGLCLGTALMSAIGHLNTEAGQRYQRASDQSESPVHFLVKPISGQRFMPAQIWFDLRRQGIRQSQPVLTGQLQLQSGETVLIRGVNTLAALEVAATYQRHRNTKAAVSSGGFGSLSGDTRFLLSSELATRLSLGRELRFKNLDESFGYVSQSGIGPWLISDISLAHRLLQQQGWLNSAQPQVSLIELGALSESQRQRVQQIIAERASFSKVSQQSFDALSESFFFNLSALALLGYVVALFLSLNALRLMLSARQRMQQQMATLGCLPQRLTQALLIEMLLVCGLCAALGNAIGFWIAQGLIFDVTTTLVSLYRLDRALQVHWQWSSFAIGFVMNLLALAAMLFILKRQAGAFTTASLAAAKKPHWQRRLRWFAGAIFLFAGPALFHFASNKFQALLLCAWVIALFALCTLPLLRLISRRLRGRSFPASSGAAGALAHWLKSNTHRHLQDVGLAVLAFLIALGAAIGTQVMVRSFALTLDAYLQQRLQADIYLRAQDPTTRFDAAHFYKLQQLSGVQFVRTMETAAAVVQQGALTHSAEVLSYGELARDFQHLARSDAQSIRLADLSQGQCLANEPTALRYGWQRGETLRLHQGSQQLSCTISGFFYDYGSQGIRVVVTKSSLRAAGFTRRFMGYALLLNNTAGAATLTQQLLNDFGYSEDDIVQNASFKRSAKKLFSSTFAVTDVLNTLIVAIALIAIWVSFLSLNQQQKNQFAVVQALGVSPGQLFIGQFSV